MLATTFHLAGMLLFLAACALPAAAQMVGSGQDGSQVPAGNEAAAAGQPNLTFQKFPAEFADYYTTQRLTGNPTEPRPFCKSGKPLLIDGSKSPVRMQAILDESGGTGSGYDTLYIDTGGDGEFANPTAYKVASSGRKTGLEGRPLVGYFDNVTIASGAAGQEAVPRAQVFVEHSPATPDGEFVLNLIPAQWAVGTIQVNGQSLPVAMVDGPWSANVARRHGLDAYGVNQMAPGEDAAALRGSYLILGKPGQESLEPGDPNGWLGQGGSARALNTQYMVLDSGVYEVHADQAAGGVNLQLAPAEVATSTIDLNQVPHAGRLAMFGTNACVLLENPGPQVQVPGGTYYVPAFGAYTVEVPAGGGNVTLPAPSDIEAGSAQGYNPLADREQKLFTADPPGGEVQWSQPQSSPFAFANRQASWRTMELQVVAADTRRGVGGARVGVNASSGNGWTRTGHGSRTLTTDAAGRCTIRVPGTDLLYVSLQVHAKGFVPAWKSWRVSGEDLPAQYTWVAEAGTTIGGVVRDERDRPISGVSIRIVAETFATSDLPEPLVGLLDIRTDRRGKWRCDAVPARPSQLRFKLMHPDYISDTEATRTAPIERLRDLTAVMVMKQGVSVEVRVADPKGSPLAGASVYWGEYWEGTSAKTDREGRYRIRNQPPGSLTVGVRASGCATDLKKVTVEPNMRAVEFKMEAAKGIKGRVIDTAGNPIPLASIVLQQWRSGFRLYWSTQSDAQGRWSWPDAPNDEVGLTIDAPGTFGDYIRVTAGPEEHVSRLKKTVTIRGRVVDAGSGGPVPAFKAILGFDEGGTVFWMRYMTVNGVIGAYTIVPQQQFEEYRVRIEAEGYFPGVSEIFTDAELPPSVDIALSRGEDLTGMVVGPDGRPLADVQVVVALESQPLDLTGGRIDRRDQGAAAKSGADGRFRLPPQDEAYTLIGVHEQGFGQITRKAFEKSGRIRLEPWGRIEGVVRSGGKPLANGKFSLSSGGHSRSEESPVRFFCPVVADDAGRFSISNVVPGIQMIDWSRGNENNPYEVSCAQVVEIKPGQTTHLEMGGGRTVTGRMRLPGRENLKIEMYAAGGYLRVVRAGPKVPASLPATNPEALQAWYDGWLKSDEGKAYRLAERNYWFRPQDDGTFEVPDVAAGRYVLDLSIMESTGPQAASGAAILEIDVPAASEGGREKPLDLGPVELKRCARLKPGDAAPAFTAKNFDGQTVSLSSYRGKYLLLHFWGSGGDIDSNQLVTLKTLQKQYGQDDRVAILGLGVGRQVDDVRVYAQRNGMTWSQAYLGEWSKTSVPADYGASWLPYTVLVSPEGRIVEARMSGRQIRAEITKALGKPKTSQASTSQPAATSQSAGR